MCTIAGLINVTVYIQMSMATRTRALHLSQLVSLLAAGQLAELLLGDALDEAVEPGKDLVDVCIVDRLELRAADELLDADEALAVEVVPETLIHLLEHALPKRSVLALGVVKDLIQVARVEQLLGPEALAHDEGLVGLCGAEALDEGAGGAALGDEADGGEGGEEEGVGHGVDEVGEGDEGGGEANDGAVEADDEDLGVRGEGVRDVEVEGDEGGEPELVRVGRVDGGGAADGDVGAAG